MARRTVLATPFELMLVAQGDEVTFADQNGDAVVIRLFKPEELMDAQRRASANLPGGGPGPMTREQAEKACRPLGQF